MADRIIIACVAAIIFLLTLAFGTEAQYSRGVGDGYMLGYKAASRPLE